MERTKNLAGFLKIFLFRKIRRKNNFFSYEKGKKQEDKDKVSLSGKAKKGTI